MALDEPERKKVETKTEAEGLIPLFQFERVLNQDQNGRRITLLGSIKNEPAVFTLERAAFSSDTPVVSALLSRLSNTTNLGANDVYRWYMANQVHSPSTVLPLSIQQSETVTGAEEETIGTLPDLKLNLIYPATAHHIKKYTSQRLRYVTETPEVYKTFIRPYIEKTQRTPKRLDWIYNILNGLTEQEDVLYWSPNYIHDPQYEQVVRIAAGATPEISNKPPSLPEGFLLLPDLNWDRKTLTSLHLLALVQRRDIWSLRDLHTGHLDWLKGMLTQIRTAAAKAGTELAQRNSGGAIEGNSTPVTTVDADEIKCYVHYQPTYHHFHVHAVHVMLEPEGNTQSVGKGFALEGLIAMLEMLRKGQEVSERGIADGSTRDGEEDEEVVVMGLDRIDLTYYLGEENELWKKCFGRIKAGERIDLLDE